MFEEGVFIELGLRSSAVRVAVFFYLRAPSGFMALRVYCYYSSLNNYRCSAIP